MAKRHESLIPLARDHHEALLVALRLQQGKNALERLWSHDPLWQANYVAEFYEQHLRPHFNAEEQALFPLAKEHVKKSVPLVDELIAQHRAMEERILLFKKSNATPLEQQLKEFGALLEDHIRKEDRILFPMFEEHASAELLSEALKQIHSFYPH
jgi:hemerythrin-like domain-containing protein